MVDPRGPRFAAGVTVVVLTVTILAGSPWLLLAQTAVFSIGALAGIGWAPYGLLYRFLVRPRLGPPADLEEAAPLRAAQAVGAVFGTVGSIGFLVGVPALGYTAAALAFAAAFLNAAFGFCLGCQIHLAVRSMTVKGTRA